MAQLKDILAIEYSVSQDCFHVEPLFDMMIDNQQLAIKEHQHPPYCLIDIAPDKESANAIIEDYRARIVQNRQRSIKGKYIF